jgi:uncharacterized membrane protein
MINRAELKRHAKDQLKGKWGLAIGSIAVIILIQIVFNIISRCVEDNTILFIIITLVSMIVSSAMGTGTCRLSLNYAYDDKQPAFADIFSGFQVILKVIGLFILLAIIILVGTILLVIPGIIFSYMFSQAYYILADDNSKSIIQCLKESAGMMKGYKFKYFVLLLSFLGWTILGLIPLGIGLLWVMPYMNVTVASFYLKVKDNYYGANIE